VVASYETVNRELAFDGRDGALHPWVVGGQKADKGQHQQTGVEALGAEILDE
jgi:hypothetical protein